MLVMFVLMTSRRYLHHWSPGCRKPKNEEASEADHGRGSFLGPFWIRAVKRKVTDGSKDQKTDKHPTGASNERLSSTIVLDNVEAIEGHAEIDAVLEPLATERRHETERLTKIICVTNEFLIPVPAKTTVP